MTLTYLSRPPSFKDCKISIFGAVYYVNVDGFHQNYIETFLEGIKSNKILMALTLFLWSNKYFVISKFNFKNIIRLILHLSETNISLLKFGKAYLQTQLTLFFFCFFAFRWARVVIVFL